MSATAHVLQELLALIAEIEATEHVARDQAIGQACADLEELLCYADAWDQVSALSREAQ